MSLLSAREDHDAIYEVLGVVAEVRDSHQAAEVRVAGRQDLTRRRGWGRVWRMSSIRFMH